MLDNNQKAAYGILAAVAAVMAVTKFKNKMPHMGSFAKHHQGYAARQDESLGMRTGSQSHFTQSMKDRRNESYGKFGKRMMEHPHQHINR